jgi:uncharacterized protein YxeA
MKRILSFVPGAFLAVLCGAFMQTTFETDITAHYMQVTRNEVEIESPQPDGRTKKVVYAVYIDRIFRSTISNEVIYATNTITTGNAIIKIEPMDDRRAH